MKKIILFAVYLCALTSSLPLLAADPSVDFGVDIGAEQDSNLNVAELDKKSGQSDIATIVNARVDAKGSAANDKLSLSGGYAYSSKTYQKYDDFDLAIHQLSADANYNFTVLTAGANYFYAGAQLGGNDFLDLNQTSLYISKLINERVYLRAASNFQEKKFSGLAARNANNKGLSGDAFIFFNQGKTFVSLGVSTEQENANARQFDYQGTTIKARVSNKFSMWGKENKLQAGVRRVERDYSGFTPEIDKKRFDSNNVIDAEWEIGLTKNLTLSTKVEGGDYDSNLASAKYSETRTSLLLKARF